MVTIVQIQPPPPRSSPVLEPLNVFMQVWSGWFRRLVDNLNSNFSALNAGLPAGFSGTVSLAKLTVTGTNGSLTVVNGLITTYVAPT